MSTTTTRIKICGITRPEDGAAALEEGVYALGFVLAEGSPRRLRAAEAEELLAAIRREAPRPFAAVAVLDRCDAAEGARMLDELGFDRVQFHGTEGLHALRVCLAAMEEPRRHAWGAVRVRDALSLDGAEELACEAIVLDSHVEGRAGGTGQAFDWTLAAPLARHRNVVLAGGLTPENVADAVRAVRPWMVDVSSGVESSPGLKDAARIRAFVEAVRGA